MKISHQEIRFNVPKKSLSDIKDGEYEEIHETFNYCGTLKKK